jgi:uncharacterized protein YegJ (DUF2314 family)
MRLGWLVILIFAATTLAQQAADKPPVPTPGKKRPKTSNRPPSTATPEQTDSETRKPLAENAPKDRPAHLSDEEAIKKLDDAIAPYVAKARATLPEAKNRFKKGLARGEVLSVTVRLRDSEGRFEQVFVEVKSWQDESITGLLATVPTIVTGHKEGEKMTVSEKDLYDWTISKPDGTEDGNFVGKFLDTYRP